MGRYKAGYKRYKDKYQRCRYKRCKGRCKGRNKSTRVCARVGSEGTRVGVIKIKCKVLKNVSLSPDPVGKCCSRL